MAKVYCSLSLQAGRCPECGGEITPARYYTAQKGASTLVSQKADYSTMKKTTTFSTEYSDIQPHTGEICLHCYQKKEKPKRIAGLIILLLGLLSAIATIIVLIASGGLSDLDNQLLFWGPAALAALGLWLGWVIVKNADPTYPHSTANDVSRYFVSTANITGRAEGQTLLTAGQVEAMQNP